MRAATDVFHASIPCGSPEEHPIGTVGPEELRALAREGHFAQGSLGPKVEAALRFLEGGGRRAVITSLDHLAAAVDGEAGTVLERTRTPA
jgi:carbamate kinase